jgi:hypothetical protein
MAHFTNRITLAEKSCKKLTDGILAEVDFIRTDLFVKK